MKRILVVLIGVALLSVLACGQAEQQADSGSMGTSGSMGEGQGEEAAAEPDYALAELHGGMAVMADDHIFEVVCLKDGIRVYAYDAEQASISLAGTTAEVALAYTQPTLELKTMPMEHVDAPDVEYGNELLPAHDYLYAAVDLSAVESGALELGFAVTGLAANTDQSAKFEASFESLVDRPYFCPMHADAWGTSSESLCPICGGMKTSVERSID